MTRPRQADPLEKEPELTTSAYACLVLPVAIPAPALLQPWELGPLPVPLTRQPAGGSPRSGSATAADETARREYFSARTGTLLFGTSKEPRRWHRWSQGDVEALELQMFPDLPHAWLVLHLRLAEDDPLSDLSERVRGASGPTPPAWWPQEARALEPAEHRRVRTLTHLVPAAGAVPSAIHPALTGLPPERQWLLLAAAGSPLAVFDLDDPSLVDGLVRLSPDWRGLVLRDGIGLVATSPPDAAFHAAGRAYARSIYLDVLLLAQAQHTAVTGLADAVARVVEGDVDSTAVVALERDLLDLRTRLWGAHLSDRTSVPHDLLLAYQRQHRLDRLLDEVIVDLTDLSRYLQARALEQQAKEEASRREVQEGVALAVACLAPLSIVYSAAAVADDPSWSNFAVSSGAAVTLSVLAGGALASLLRRRRAKPDTIERGRSRGLRAPAQPPGAVAQAATERTVHLG